MPSYSMSKRDKTILKKILKYCEEASYAHQYFHEDKAFFYNEKEGHVYRSSVAMDIFQIGELAKSLTPETRRAYLLISRGVGLSRCARYSPITMGI